MSYGSSLFSGFVTENVTVGVWPGPVSVTSTMLYWYFCAASCSSRRCTLSAEANLPSPWQLWQSALVTAGAPSK